MARRVEHAIERVRTAVDLTLRVFARARASSKTPNRQSSVAFGSPNARRVPSRASVTPPPPPPPPLPLPLPRAPETT